ncbi:hypothetical protein [Methylacidimicrobium sp. AP8]|uniref:hypothetical protein n=1 Tax=Methylacidimicrobium sp. AP8 TaxID=2730359 RepID=UPI001920A847|nr:hypothetical protein [Methylacidimicrobium sp. AP8]
MALAWVPELFAGLVQTSKGLRLSILSPPEASAAAGRVPADPVAEKGGQDKRRPRLVATKGAPKGRVKIQPIASGRARKAHRAASEANPVAARK